MTFWPDDIPARRGMERQLDARRALLADGARPLGWKAGFGTPAAIAALGTGAPLIGFMTDRSLLDSGADVAVAGWAAPAIEPEIAVRLGRDLAAGADRATAAAAIDAIAAAIEVIDLDGPLDSPEALLAGNIFHRHVVLGPFDAGRAGVRLAGVRVDVEGDKRYAAAAEPEALLGDLVEVVRRLADVLGAFGERLQAGEVVITGSIVPLVRVHGGERIRCAFAELGELSVQLT